MAAEELKLYVLIGLPGSGKSHWVKIMNPKRAGCIVINRDAMRYMVNGGTCQYTKEKEKTIKEGCAGMLRDAMLRGMADVIIDETNTTQKQRAHWIEIVKESAGRLFCKKVRVIAVVMKETDAYKCVMQRMRDSRGQSATVWWNVIAKMSAEYEAPEMGEGFDEIIEA